MNNLGQRIKTLRKKNDLTQEKLADYLGVTYQSVSKWETGTTMPDLGLIVPLAKLLHVSADELLGMNESDESTKRAELEKRYDDTFRTGDMNARLQISEEAVKELPGDMKWMTNLAWDVWCCSMENEETGPVFEASLERAIRLFDIAIENTDDDGVKAYAISGIKQCLVYKGQKAEAKRYVEMYPDAKVSKGEYNELIADCLEGEERILHNQKKLLEEQLIELLRTLLWKTEPDRQEWACHAMESILTGLFPDGNYLAYHWEFSHCCMRRALLAAREKDAEKAREYLKKALYHAKEYDKICDVKNGVSRYTAPLFDRIDFDPAKQFVSGTATQYGSIVSMYHSHSEFASWRQREDFEALFV